MSYDERIKERFNGLSQYSASATALWLKKENPKNPGEPVYVPIANGTILLDRIIERDDGIELLQLTAICQGNYAKKHTIKAEQLTTSKFESAAPTVGLIVDKMKMLIDSIHAQMPHCPREKVYTHTGWEKIDGRLVFLHMGGAIGSDAKVSVELEPGLERYRFSDGDHSDKWDVFKKLVSVAPDRVMYPLIAYAALSPLLYFLRSKELEPGFLMFLYGKTQTRKSTLAALMLCFFGNFTSTTLPSNFISTPNFNAVIAYTLADVLAVYDDLLPYPDQNESKKQANMAQRLSREYGNNTGRGRMKSDATLQKRQAPRGTGMVTGELYPDISESGIARMAVIELKSGDVDLSTLTDIQQRQDRLSECMKEYILWLAEKGEHLSETMKDTFIKYRAEAQAIGHGRTAEQIAFLRLSVMIGLFFLKEKGIIADTATIKNTAEKVFNEWSKNQAGTLKSLDPCIVFLSELNHLIQMQGIQFLRELGTPLSAFHGGYQDDEYYYLDWKNTCAKVSQAFQRRGEQMPLKDNNYKTLKKNLANAGYIEKGTNGEPERQKRAGGKILRFVFLKKSTLDNLPTE